MKRLFLLFSVAILLQSCLGTYPQGSGGYPTNGGNSDGGNSTGGNQYPSGNDRPQTSPQSNPNNYPSNPQSGSRSADRSITVADIRLTSQYTILYLSFTNTN